MLMPPGEMERCNFKPESKSSLLEAQEVFGFLKGSRLEKYAENFVEQGFTAIEDVKLMTESDLETCGVLPGHRKRLVSHIKKLDGPHDPEPSTSPTEGGLTVAMFPGYDFRNRNRFQTHFKMNST